MTGVGNPHGTPATKRVPWRMIGEVLRIKNGSDHKLLGDGDVPVYGSGGIMRHVDRAAATGPSVLIPRKGSLGNIFYVEGPFWVVDTIFRTEIDETIVFPKFLYYVLLTMRLGEMNQAGGVPSQTQAVLNSLRIPVPPLEVQQEIVRVLDQFSQLEAELEAELEARRVQYSFYREDLMSGISGSHWARLGDVLSAPLSNGRSVPDGEGYPVLRLGALRGPMVDFSQCKRGSWSDEEGGRFRVASGDLLAARGNGNKQLLARASMVKSSPEIAFPDTMIRIRPDLSKISQEFLFYVWECRASRRQVERVAKLTSGVWKIGQKDLAEVTIPVPPREVQDRIVEVLDRLSALVNDLSIGLPAELAARRKQYEYYRDKLLTFEEAPA
ncbi:restriction endonuclease subunit S [Kineococcus sp. SYSU DK001]|uniref:restriction endonuclease subunit S n=1 Tax=Kineococcus sp. SYSU DK001 TaxID=3383122 RepID=UPI003D7CC48A